MREANLKRIEAIFRTVLDDPGLRIDEDSSPETVADWDSFANIQLLAAVEEAFQVKFTVSEALELRTVLDILCVVERKNDLTAYENNPTNGKSFTGHRA